MCWLRNSKISFCNKIVSLVLCVGSIVLPPLENVKADEAERLAVVLASRFESVKSLKWKFESERLIGNSIDWTTSSFDSDPFVESKSLGLTAFNSVEGSAATGSAVFVQDRLFSIEFVHQGRSYQTFFDGEVFAQRSPTSVDTGEKSGPDVVEISETAAAGDLRGLGVSVAGYHFAPMRVPQLRSCFGDAEESISLADFVQLLQDEKLAKDVEIVNSSYLVRLKAFVEKKEAGDVTYRISDDGYIDSIEWKAGEHWSASETIEFSNPIELSGTRLATSATFVDWSNSAARLHRFDEWSTADASDLDFDIPEGALVNDDVNQLAYTNTGGVGNEARAAELYALQNGLALPESAADRGWIQPALLVSAILLLLVIVFLSKKKHKRSSKVDGSKSFLLGLLMVLNPFTTLNASAQEKQTGAAQDQEFVRWVPGNGWVLQKAIPGMSHVSQCGSTCVMLALRMSNREFDPFLVAKHLKPNRGGISMLSIKNVLAAHGISAEARTNLSFGDVENLARKYQFVIVHVPQYQRFGQIEAHYLIVYKNAGGEVIVLDPPFDPVKASATDQDVRSQMVGLTVLLCDRVEADWSNWGPREPTIGLTGESFENGVWSGSVSLANDGADAVAIVRGQASCNCVQLDFQAKQIPAGGEVTYDIRIEQDRWGDSSQKIRFVDALGVEKYVDIVGDSFAPQVNAADSFGNPVVEHDFQIRVPFKATNERQEHSFRIRLKKELNGNPVISTSASGVSADVQLSENGSDLLVSVFLSPEFTQKLSLGLPRSFSSMVKVGNSAIADLKFRAERELHCSVQSHFTDAMTCKLIFNIDSESEWQLDACEVPGLNLLSSTSLSDGRFSVSLERSDKTVLSRDESFSGVVRFSHGSFLPFEKLVAVRWESEAVR